MRINYVIGLITDNYPVNYSANNSKFSLLARALRNTGHKVSIINTPWCKSNKKQDQICYDNDIPVVTWEVHLMQLYSLNLVTFCQQIMKKITKIFS